MSTIVVVRRFSNWMGRVLPPWLGWAAVTLIVMRLGQLWLTKRAAEGDEFDQMIWGGVVELCSRTLLGLCAVVGAIYGLWRAAGRNPLTMTAYRNWLSRSPWESPEPLPWGNVLPGLQDLVPLAFLTAIVTGVVPELQTLIPAAAALIAYSSILLLVVLNWRPSPLIYCAIWVAELGIAVYDEPWMLCVLLCAVVAIAAVSAHLALRDFRRLSGSRMSRDFESPTVVNDERPIGSPWSALAPHARGTMMSWTNAAAIAMTLGIPLWCFRMGDGSPSVPFVLQLLTFPAVCAGMRFAAYRLSVHAPLTIWGRFRTGRLILPRYDRIFLAPLLIALAGMLASAAVLPLPLLATTKLAMVCVVCVVLMFGLSPSRDQWILTGEHRLNLRACAGNSRRTQSPEKRSEG